nr:toll/interleukin-1 receptor domain-containing protein [Pseudomonadota bacterium]
MATPPRDQVFISYSHKDEAWKKRLVEQLRVLELEGQFTVWEDRQIAGGDDWLPAIEQALNDARAAVLLISASFLTSKFIRSVEVPRLLQRRQSEGMRVIPLIVKDCPWQKVAWLSPINCRPTDGKPLTSLRAHQKDTALADLATELADLLKISGNSPHSGPAAEHTDLNLPPSGRLLIGRDAELARLDAAWADPGTHVFSIVAWGGTGKTALVNHWWGYMAADRWRGAQRVFGWTFYSQGAGDDRAASSDQFIDRALRFFGDPQPESGSPWDKGDRLAVLIRKYKTLLILDGLEPLQHPPGFQEGRLKDPAMQTLLRGLDAANPGLCVVTTREAVADLAAHCTSTAQILNLERLSPESGVKVLKELGVDGPPEELLKAVEDVKGHALALNLLGKYLYQAYHGDVRRRSEVRLWEADEGQDGHARKVMAAYESWFGDGPELSILYLLGLFDRAADGASLAALRREPAIPGLTDVLVGLSQTKWNVAVAHLREAGLVESNPRAADTLDAHPLMREHFGRRLEERFPAAWRAGHGRLYEHLRDTTPEFPNTLEAMLPLFAALVHGCLSGRHKEA